jgi:phosphomannomutase
MSPDNTDAVISPAIFKSYDVRGEVDVNLNECVAELIGRAVVKVLGAKCIAVGRDMRSHGPRIEAALVKGITGAGANVIRIGQCSTPMSYYAAATLDVDGAVMVTASHNPAKDNGFKFCKRGGEPMGDGTGLELVRDLVLSGEANGISAETTGTVSDTDVLDDWCTHMMQYLGGLRPMKIVFDFGNSVMGPIIRELMKKVDPDGKLETIWLFEEPDGTFPWHPADPLKEVNLRHLQGAVLATGADLGVSFDGDGDRLAFVDENAKFVGCDLVTGRFAQYFLGQKENAGKNIIYDLRSTRAVVDAVEEAGGKAEMGRVGHSHLKAAMRGGREGRVRDESQTGEIIFGGELSGHFYFQDCFCVDSSERALILALSVMAADERPFSEQIAPLRKYFHSGEINFSLPSEEAKQAILEQIPKKFSDNNIFQLDGVSVEGSDWWFNVRASNTEPLLRLTAESFKDAESMQTLVADIEGIIIAGGGSRKS